MDNLLSSFDQLSPTTTYDPPASSTTSRPRSPPYEHSASMSRITPRPRGHANSNSISSDRGGPSHDDSPARLASPSPSHSRRGSAFSVARLPSIVKGTRRTSSDAQVPTDGAARSRSFSSRQGSLSNNMGIYDQITETPQALRNGSESRDNAPVFSANDPFRRSGSTQDVNDSVLSRGRPVPPANSAYGTSAPEPFVPGGPATSMTSQRANFNPLNSHPQKPSNLRSESVNSQDRQTSRPLPGQSLSVRDQASDFVRASSMRNLHSPENSATPPGSMQKYAASPAEDKQRNFFKRVFGSSASRTNLNSDLTASAASSPLSSRHGSQMTDAQSSRGEAAPAPGQPGQALNKKPSSFFRRRKKSVTDITVAPALPTQFAEREMQNSASSGSLYQAMNPYINADGPTTSPPKPVARSATYERRVRKDDISPSTSEDTDDPDMFHTGYTPPPDASIKKLAPLGHNPAGTDPEPRRPSAAPSAALSLASSTKDGVPAGTGDGSRPTTPQTKMKVRKKEKPSILGQAQSFYNDSSDVDDKHREINPASSTTSDLAGPKTTTSPLLHNSFFGMKSPSATTSPRLGSGSRGSDGLPASHDRSRPELSISTVSPPLVQDGFATNKDGVDPRDSSRLWLEPSPVDRAEPLAEKETFYTSTEIISRLDNLPAKIPSSNGLPFDAATPSTMPTLPTGDDYAKESRKESLVSLGPSRNASVATSFGGNDSSHDDRIRAQQIYDGEQYPIPKAQAAAWLGENKPVHANTLKLYMELYNFTGKTILAGLRMLCDRLVLKGESQQVDRILQTFAERWCESNPNHAFRLVDVVHTVCYSLLLLNTDLHMADIESKMTRAQFVKNTLPNIKRIVAEAPAEAQNTAQAQRPGLPWQDSKGSFGTGTVPNSPQMPQGEENETKAPDTRRPTLTKRMSWSFGMPSKEPETVDKPQNPANAGSDALVNERFDGKMTEWHFELEAVLKSFFTAIKNDPLPLNKGNDNRKTSIAGSTLGPVGPSGLRRTPSIKSVTPSETMSMRSRNTGFHSMASRWTKGRNRPKMYASSTLASSRTSFDDSGSVFSPGGSSVFSKYSMGKTLTTMSTDSLGTHYMADQGFQQSIGFANALSQANAREDGVGGDDESFNAQRFLLEDDSLELAGAPWAKEGILKHKHHLEASEKKAKERNWNESFAVIEKGYLRLYTFNSKGGKTGSLGMRKHVQKGKAASIAPSVVGGGNWMQNAEQLGCFLLRQTIASILPAPGYSKARPYVWALSLPTGAVHLFQVGTREIAEEFKSTANYWSARLSKEPLVGGVDNVEYGWSDAIINRALINSIAEKTGQTDNSSKPPSRHGMTHSANNSVSMPRPSIASSMRGSMDQGTSRPKMPSDRAHLDDWTPPTQSMMASQLMEVDQLKALKDYVANVEGDLSKHNELRSTLNLAVSAPLALFFPIMKESSC